VFWLVRRKGLPQWGELVLCTVKRVTPFAAWCRLDEYPDVEGMIHISEVAGKWVYDIREFVKEEKQYVAKVVKVDYQKNHVNLSLKRVSKKDAKEKMNAFRREQRSEKILEQIAKEVGKNLDQAYEEIGFLLQEKFGDLFVAFEEIRRSKETLDKLNIPKEWVEAIRNVMKKVFKEKEVLIKAELELRSYAKDGIKKIKDVLNDISKNTGATIKYISAPKYRIEIMTKEPKSTEKKLKESLEQAIKQIRQTEGEGSYKLIR
jgi:translation initiation factor 2 subunit 1